MPFSGAGSGSSSGIVTLRKVTSKQVLNTVTETDLLNGELTVSGNTMGATSIMQIAMWGDWVQNSGATAFVPLLKLKLGATTIFAWQTNTFNVNSSATRYSWQVNAIIASANAQNAQTASFTSWWSGASGIGTVAQDATLTTGEGLQTALIGANSHAFIQANGYNSASLDMTQSQALVFTTTNATATATYDVTLKGALVTIV